MSQTQPEIAGVVISFALHAGRASAVLQGTCFTPHDRIVITTWQERARQAGFDRMVIHDRDEGDASDVGNFLSVYRSGQAWSRWCFARNGRRIHAWCCLTGADFGDFSCLAEALDEVLTGMATAAPRAATKLATSTRSFAKRVGSAA